MPRRFKAILGAFLLTGGLLFAAEPTPLRVGVHNDFHPIGFEQNGQSQGFVAELMLAIAADSGLKVELLPRSHQVLLAEFGQRQIDIIGASARSPQQTPEWAFSTPHLELRNALYARDEAPSVQSLQDLHQIRVAVVADSRSEEYLRAHGLARQLIVAPSLREAVRSVQDNRADVVLAPRLLVNEILRVDPLKDLVELPFEVPDLRYHFRFALRPENRATLAALNDSLARMRANGRYDEIYEKWVGPLESRPLRLRDVRAYWLPALAIALAVVAIIVWQRRLFAQLARQTERLRESEERLTHVFSGSADGFWDWDIRTHRVERSERWASMLGYTLAEVTPDLNGIGSILHPDDVPLYLSWRNRILSGEVDRYRIEYRLKAKSGEWLWILDRGKVVAHDENGRPRRMAGTHTDITDRKRTEAALIESQAQLKRSAQLLEQTQAASHIGGWESDLRTGLVFWTREAYRIHDTTPEEFTPTREAIFSFYEPRSRLLEAVDKAIRDATAYDLELELTTFKKRRITVQVCGRAEVENGRVTKLFGSVRDITAEKAAAQEREQLRLKMLDAQKLESLGVLAGGIAHDFNNLLTVILANASFLRVDSGAQGDERLTHIEAAARRAADLCRQMLAYAGKGNFVVELVDVSALVRDTAQLLHVSISKKARLELVLDSNLPAVEADPSQLRQVVMNLVINASEALGDGPGTIRITTRRDEPRPQPGRVVHAFDLPAGEAVCIEISDTGQGMAAATLARIFDPFFTTKFTGRGLGLAAVLGIVRSHHGTLTVDSTPGMGSRFSLFLPPSAKGTASVSAPPFPIAKASLHHGTILIADDEPSVLTTADILLRRQGYRTVLAPDGPEAVREFSRDPEGFAAVLLDLTMPGLDGVEALRAMRTINPRVRVLVMSGFSEQDVLERLRGLGEVTILRKPFNRDLLLERLAAVTATD